MIRENLREELLSRLIGLARAIEGNEELVTETTEQLLQEGLSILTIDRSKEEELLYEGLLSEKRRLVPNCFDCASPCGRTADYPMEEFWNADEERIEKKLQILERLTTKRQKMDDCLYALIVLGWNGSLGSLQRVLDKLQ